MGNNRERQRYGGLRTSEKFTRERGGKMVGDFLFFCFAREVSCQRATRQVRKKTDGRRDRKEEEKTTTKESLSVRKDEESRQKTKKVERTNEKP